MSDMAEEVLSLPNEAEARSSLPPALAAAVIPQGAPCENCRAGLREAYYVANGRVICTECRERLQGSGWVAFGLGAAAALACAAVYYSVHAAFRVNFVLVAVLAGAAVGLSVRRGARSSRLRRYRFMALGLTYLSVVSTYAPALLEMPDVDNVFQAGLRALYLPVLMLIAMKNPVTLILLVFGLHEAWKLSAPPIVHVDGPFSSQRVTAEDA
jgi:hypothetical protein